MVVLFLAFGLAAGVLTTIAGQGGGLLLLLAFSALSGPHDALAITAPALLLGNLHRSLLLRAHVDRTIAMRVVLGAVPGALVGGLLAGIMPAWSLQSVLVLMTGLAILKALGVLRFTLPRTALAPVGLILGILGGTSGGAGVLFATVLLSTGLSGMAFVATSSTVAFATHVGRVVGYASLGLFEARLAAPTLLVTAAIFAGNALGGRASDRFDGWLGRARSAALRSRIEYATLVVCVTLSVAGLG